MFITFMEAVLTLVALTGQLQPPSSVQTGYLSAYAEKPSKATAVYRQSTSQLPTNLGEFDVLVAVLDCRNIGKQGVLYTEQGNFDTIVFDCAGETDGGREWMIVENWVAEVDYVFWQKYPDVVFTRAVLVLD